MSVLVTGGVGFIGSNFILNWISSHDEPIVNIDKLTYAGNPHNLADIDNDNHQYTFIKGDIKDYVMLRNILEEFNIVSVVNFAAETHVDRSIQDPEEFIQTNIVGTLRLLEAVRSYWNELPNDDKAAFRFLHVSTDEVYGSLSLNAPAFRETNQYDPSSPYSASKASSDHLVRAYYRTYNLPTIITNCSNNYGPYQFPEKLIPLCIHRGLAGKPLPIYGDGQQIRDWLYVTDHCNAICQVLEAGAVGETYNIGGWAEKTNLEVVHTLCGILDREKPKAGNVSYSEQITFVADRPGHDRRYAIDATKIERELGWKPVETFETGMLKTVLWYLENQDWVANVTSGDYRAWIDRHYNT